MNATRYLMSKGVLRPTAAQIAQRAKCATRSVFMRYPSLNALYSEVLDDETVAQQVIERVMSQRTVKDRAKAIVCDQAKGAAR